MVRDHYCKRTCFKATVRSLSAVSYLSPSPPPSPSNSKLNWKGDDYCWLVDESTGRLGSDPGEEETGRGCMEVVRVCVCEGRGVSPQLFERLFVFHTSPSMSLAAPWERSWWWEGLTLVKSDESAAWYTRETASVGEGGGRSTVRLHILLHVDMLAVVVVVSSLPITCAVPSWLRGRLWEDKATADDWFFSFCNFF